MKIFILSLLTTLSLTATAYALTDEQATACIVGEASGQSYIEQVAIAEALRNRGTARGVYGCNAKHNATEPQWVWDQCRKAWLDSVKTNMVHGATFWEGKKFKTPYWAKDMKVTATIGETRFYREEVL